MQATPSKVTPSGWWYFVPIGLLVVFLVLAGSAVYNGFGDAQRAGLEANGVAPGIDQTITIFEPSSYTIGYGGPIVAHSAADQAELTEIFGISIVPADGGERLTLRPYDGFTDQIVEDEQYVPLLTVRFEEAGDYILRSQVHPDIPPERQVLVVLESPWGKLRAGIYRALGLVALGTFVLVVGSMILASTRKRAKAALPPPSGPGYGPSNGHPPGGFVAPGQGYPVPGYPAQGYPGQTYPSAPGQGYPGQVGPGYPPAGGYPGASNR